MKYIAFLRAINVGGHTDRIEALRNYFEALGFANVSTFIASGNMIFDADETDPACARSSSMLALVSRYYNEAASSCTRSCACQPAAARSPADTVRLGSAWLSASD